MTGLVLFVTQLRGWLSNSYLCELRESRASGKSSLSWCVTLSDTVFVGDNADILFSETLAVLCSIVVTIITHSAQLVISTTLAHYTCPISEFETLITLLTFQKHDFYNDFVCV
jgi:hypothetical protein